MKIKVIPILMNIISKVDLKPVFNKLKELDIFQEETTEITGEQALTLATEMFTELSPQLSNVSDMIIPLVATYKEISEEEAANIELDEFIKEIIKDSSIISFFKNALHKKVEQKQ